MISLKSICFLSTSWESGAFKLSTAVENGLYIQDGAFASLFYSACVRLRGN